MQKRHSLGSGISEKFCSKGGTPTRQILFTFWSDIPGGGGGGGGRGTSLNGTALIIKQVYITLNFHSSVLKNTWDHCMPFSTIKGK